MFPDGSVCLKQAHSEAGFHTSLFKYTKIIFLYHCYSNVPGNLGSLGSNKETQPNTAVCYFTATLWHLLYFAFPLSFQYNLIS